jgi:Activator of Hsp90 ATPase homolog 1-like protein
MVRSGCRPCADRGGRSAQDPNESRLEIALRPVPEGTEITITHSLLCDEETRLSHKDGWSGALDKLETLFFGEESAG